MSVVVVVVAVVSQMLSRCYPTVGCLPPAQMFAVVGVVQWSGTVGITQKRESSISVRFTSARGMKQESDQAPFEVVRVRILNLLITPIYLLNWKLFG